MDDGAILTGLVATVRLREGRVQARAVDHRRAPFLRFAGRGRRLFCKPVTRVMTWPLARRARGSGRDVINDAGGDDTLVFGPNVAADDVIYKVVGNDLYIGIAEAANPALEAHAAQAREPKTRRCSARSSG